MNMPEIDYASSKKHNDCMAQHIIVSALDSDELLKISECTSAMEMWDTLEKWHK